MSVQNEHPPLTAYSEEQRQAAMVKYKIIAPYLTDEKTFTVITEETGIAGVAPEKCGFTTLRNIHDFKHTKR